MRGLLVALAGIEHVGQAELQVGAGQLVQGRVVEPKLQERQVLIGELVAQECGQPGEGDRVPGVTLECLAEAGFRHFQVAELLFQTAHADVGQREAGLQAERLLKLLPGVVEPAVFLIEPTQIVVGQGPARLELDHLLVNFDRIGVAILLPEGFGKVLQKEVGLRLELGGPLEPGQGFIEPAFLLERLVRGWPGPGSVRA